MSHPGLHTARTADRIAQRKRDLAAIHAAAAQLGLDTADRSDSSDYREMLHGLTGKRSAAALDGAGRRRVLAHLRNCLGKGTAPKDGWHAEKMRVLWARLGAAGALDDPTEDGLARFVKSQVGVDAPRFCTTHQGNQVIEALKAWIARAEQSAETA